MQMAIRRGLRALVCRLWPMKRVRFWGHWRAFWRRWTGRLTSEMVIKTAMMGIPSLVSRSGFTAWGVEIAREVGLTVIGRLRGRRFVCLAGEDRLEFDADPAQVADEAKKHRRKASDG